MAVAVCPGSFDPVTKGHLDVFERAAKLFDKVYIVVMENSDKKYLLTMQQRLELVKACTQHIKNIEVECFDGLCTDYAEKKGAHAVVKGLRNASDLDWERQIAEVYKELSRGALDTVLLPARPEYCHISSTVVREYVKYGRDVSSLVPQEAAGRLKEILKDKI